MEKKGLLIVLSGPSGSGKGTVRARMTEKEHFAFSVSATTRPPRPGEVNGREYWFITREQFEQHIQNGDMLEYTEYNGNYYGTPLKEAMRVIDGGENLLLEIEVEGAINVKRQYPKAVLLLLLPPSFAAQEQRLRGRGTESEEVIQGRLERTREEMKHVNIYDYIVYNEDGKIDECADELISIIHAEGHSIRRNRGIRKQYFQK